MEHQSENTAFTGIHCLQWIQDQTSMLSLSPPKTVIADQAMYLCKEGDQRLIVNELSLATAFYTAAFSCNGQIAIEKVASLGEESGARVIAVLERWCQDGGPIPQVQCVIPNTPMLSVGIAAIFLSTLNPNNMVASLYKMEALLKLGRYEEVVSQCNSLVGTHHCVELVLTRALALVLLRTHSQNGLMDYLYTFTKHREKTLEFISSRQKEHLQQVVHACFDFISLGLNGHCTLQNWQSTCYDFLATLVPEDIRVRQVQAAHLFEKQQYKECVSIYSKALDVLSANGATWDDRAPGLLIGRAAAYFSLGGRVPELMQDLTAAFEFSPSLAKRWFEELFSAADIESIQKISRAALEEGFASYREAVRTRLEVRSDGNKGLLSAVISTLHFLIQISPAARRELNVRLADCYILEGDIKSTLDICNALLDSEQETYHNTILALRGFCHLHAKRCQEALQDFQKIIEHSSPHPISCIKALCGRGLIRAWEGSTYFTALDYITACRLRFKETSFVIKAYIPWNQRGFLLVVLQEEAQKILERKQNASSSSALQSNAINMLNGFQMKEGNASAAHQLAFLLLDLDASSEASRILCADALYRMDQMNDAQKILLVELSKTSQKSAILARLALLQLKKGFVYDCNQFLKKIAQTGEISSFFVLVKILKDEDRTLMQRHCHSRALTVLKHKQGVDYIKEAIVYLSFAISAAGGFAVDSLLARARCYGQLGQKKTAIFDFNVVLKEDPTNAQALCGKGFIHLTLNQEKEAVRDLTAAIKADPVLAVAEILSLKPQAQALIHRCLFSHCRDALSEHDACKEPCRGETLKDCAIVAESLVKINSKDTKSHILYVDLLAADGRHKEALTYLEETFGERVPDDATNLRFGLLHAKERNMTSAAHVLASLATQNYEELGYLLNFLDLKQRENLAQVASKEGNALAKKQCHAKAVGYYSLAILASKSNPRYLRQRAACLAYLKDYKAALKDMSIVQNHGTNAPRTRVKDYCFQGHMLLSISEEELAVGQYMKAFELEESLTLANIPTGHDRERLSKAFLKTAESCFAMSHYEDAWKTTEYGLMVDPDNHELKKLRTRIKREACGCRVQ
ncbi:tetratricopeptide repeat protein 34 [Sceloporus undulatus]|uniref:tetratricopeptide repeat protein 34 n=1 Tax=Sceloporus undulatus TaxID=8520 RepID=UPI001C4AE1EE|nr:tetratricopeptide repeat protein 34 [Sceloporus undulatus]